MTSEIIYAAIPGFPGYRAGNDGSIQSCWGRGAAAKKSFGPWRNLRPVRDRKGYLRLCVKSHDGAIRQMFIHRLILFAFVGPPKNGDFEVAHSNGIPNDNRLENLRWDTRASNHADKKKHGTYRFGESQHNAVLSEDDVKEIRARRSSGETTAALAKSFGVTPGNIRHICKRATWRHI